jgi:hypothetical protein
VPAMATVRFVDTNHGWAVADDTTFEELHLWSTVDGGRHYTPIPAVTASLMHAGDNSDVQFVDDTHGFMWSSSIVGEGWGLKRTSDGGRTWQNPSSSRVGPAWFGTPASFEFVSSREGYAVGMTEAGKPPPNSDLGYSADLYRTNDGGTTWQRYGPLIPGPHAAGLPTIKGGALDLPVVRYQGGVKTLELWAGSRSSNSAWHLTASVAMTGRDLVSAVAMNQPVAVFLDGNDAVAVDGKQILAVSAGQAPRRTALPGPFVDSLTVANGLVYANMYRGLFVSADGGFTWKSVKLPSP